MFKQLSIGVLALSSVACASVPQPSVTPQQLNINLLKPFFNAYMCNIDTQSIWYRVGNVVDPNNPLLINKSLEVLSVNENGTTDYTHCYLKGNFRNIRSGLTGNTISWSPGLSDYTAYIVKNQEK